MAAAAWIELRGLAKSFRAPRGTVDAVRGVDITIERGETVALLGPNGAGKSTTIDMLLGLLAPDAGSVSLFGAPPEDAITAGTIGAMLQTGALIGDVSGRELLAMMASLYADPLPVEEVIALVGIEEIAGRRTEKLSGGEAQRVRFAVALISDPALLVLNEPTVGMDVEGRHAFWTTMHDFASRGKTVVFATHAIVTLYAGGVALGVTMPADRWLSMTLLRCCSWSASSPSPPSACSTGMS